MRKFLIFLFLFFCAYPVFALDNYHAFGPLPVRTQNPLYLQFIGMPLERAVTLRPRLFSTSLNFSYSNVFEYHPRLNDYGVNLDMEILRAALEVRYGISENIEVGVEVPALFFGGGFLDSFIQGYHDTFGFPNGGRNLIANGNFSYQVKNHGSVVYEAHPRSVNLGDISLISKIHLIDEGKSLPAFALKGVLKVPTGSSDLGSGSGNLDVGFTFLAEKSYKRLHGYSQLGFMVLGKSEVLSSIVKKGGWFGSAALEFNLSHSLSLISQIDMMSPLFRNVTINELADPAVDLTFGLSGVRSLTAISPLFKQIFYKTSFTEDVTSRGPSVDFTLFFQVGLVY